MAQPLRPLALPDLRPKTSLAQAVSGMSWTQEHSANGLQNRRKRVGSRKEQALQKQIIDYVRYAMRYNGRPLTDWLFHVPNGGARSVVEGAIFKGLGVKPGVPDLVLPILSGGYCGSSSKTRTGR
jgi:hypothetical protein